jgi:hypothetical protein
MAAPDGQSPDDYARWINERIGAEVRARREKLGVSAYLLGKERGVSDPPTLSKVQTIADKLDGLINALRR